MYDLNELIIKIQDASFDEKILDNIENDNINYRTGKLTDKQFKLGLQIPLVNEDFAQNPYLTNDQFDILLSLNNVFVNNYLSLNKYITDDQRNKLLGLNISKLNHNLYKYMKLNDEKFNELLNSKYLLEAINANIYLTENQIDYLLNNKKFLKTKELANNPNISLSQIKKLFGGNIDKNFFNTNIYLYMSSKSNLNKELIDEILNEKTLHLI